MWTMRSSIGTSIGTGIVTWRKEGGPPPLIYFQGRVNTVEALTGMLSGVFTSQLTLWDKNSIVFTYTEPRLLVEDEIELIAVCDELRAFTTVGSAPVTVPFCSSWQVRRSNP